MSKKESLYLIAPSSPFDLESFETGVDVLREHFEVYFDESIRSKDGYLAGSSARRLTEIHRALGSNPKAILCARGGYGAMDLLPLLDEALITSRSIPIVGFSDVTALHLLWSALGVPSIHGPMVARLGREVENPDALMPIVDAIAGRFSTIRKLRALAATERVVEGTFIGGNLSIVAALVGTPFFPKLKESILFLEEIGERAYRVDRLLTSLRLRGVFNEVSAVVLGEFVDCFDSGEVDVESAIQRALSGVSCPVVMGAPVGHGAVNLPLSLGTTARLEIRGEHGTLFQGVSTAPNHSSSRNGA